MSIHQNSPGRCCTLKLKTVYHHDHNYDGSRQCQLCCQCKVIITHSELITRYMFGEATQHSCFWSTCRTWQRQLKKKVEYLKLKRLPRWSALSERDERRMFVNIVDIVLCLHLSCVDSAVAVYRTYPNQFLTVYGLHYQPYSWTRGLRFMKLENGGGARLGRLPPRQ